jgi:hypothetical protein
MNYATTWLMCLKIVPHYYWTSEAHISPITNVETNWLFKFRIIHNKNGSL